MRGVIVKKAANIAPFSIRRSTCQRRFSEVERVPSGI